MHESTEPEKKVEGLMCSALDLEHQIAKLKADNDEYEIEMLTKYEEVEKLQECIDLQAAIIV